MAVGFDTLLDDATLVGASASYTRSDASLNEQHDARAQVRTPQAMLYAGSTRGSLELRGVVGYAQSAYRTERRMALFDLTPTVAEHTAREWSMYGEAARAIGSRAGYTIEPLFALRYARTAEEGYTESGGAASLALDPRTSQSFTSEAGARFIRELPGCDGTFELRAAWSRDYSDLSSRLTAHLASDRSGDGFSVVDDAPGRDAFLVDLKLTARLPGDFSVRLNYAADVRDGGSPQQFIAASVRRVW
jgi:outer membrane autotransporter protein